MSKVSILFDSKTPFLYTKQTLCHFLWANVTESFRKHLVRFLCIELLGCWNSTCARGGVKARKIHASIMFHFHTLHCCLPSAWKKRLTISSVVASTCVISNQVPINLASVKIQKPIWWEVLVLFKWIWFLSVASQWVSFHRKNKPTNKQTKKRKSRTIYCVKISSFLLPFHMPFILTWNE